MVDIIAPVTDYVSGSLTTTLGDLIKRGGSVNERLPVGAANRMLKVNNAGNDLEYEAFANQVTRDGLHATQASSITITATTTTIISQALADIVVGDIYLITAISSLLKGAVSGVTRLHLQRDTGTGVLNFAESNAVYQSDRHQLATATYRIALTTIAKVQAAGTYTLKLSAISLGSNATASAGGSYLSIYRLR